MRRLCEQPEKLRRNLFASRKSTFGDGIDVVFGPRRKTIFAATQFLGADLVKALPEKGHYFGDDLNSVPPNANRAVILADHSFDLRISGNASKRDALLTIVEGKRVPHKGLTVYGHHSAEHVLVACACT